MEKLELAAEQGKNELEQRNKEFAEKPNQITFEHKEFQKRYMQRITDEITIRNVKEGFVRYYFDKEEMQSRMEKITDEQIDNFLEAVSEKIDTVFRYVGKMKLEGEEVFDFFTAQKNLEKLEKIYMSEKVRRNYAKEIYPKYKKEKNN